MASPHAAGVAALAVSAKGHKEGKGGFGLSPTRSARSLLGTATNHACPTPPLQTYTDVGRSAEFDALCTGTADFNSFYGDGIVNALGVVSDDPLTRAAPARPREPAGMPSAHPSGRHTAVRGGPARHPSREVSRCRAPSPARRRRCRGSARGRRSPPRGVAVVGHRVPDLEGQGGEGGQGTAEPDADQGQRRRPDAGADDGPEHERADDVDDQRAGRGGAAEALADPVVDQVAQGRTDGSARARRAGRRWGSWAGPDPLSESRSRSHRQGADEEGRRHVGQGHLGSVGHAQVHDVDGQCGERGPAAEHARRPRTGGPAGAPRAGPRGRRPAGPSRTPR